MAEYILSDKMAMSPYHTIKQIWTQFKTGTLKLDDSQAKVLRGSCITVRKGKTMLFLELCDGSTIETLQCICDAEADLSKWTPLFEHCHRGATVELTGVVQKSPASGQPIEFVVSEFKCLGIIKDPETYFLGQQGFLHRDALRLIPHQRHHSILFTAIQILKQTCYESLHNSMNSLGIGEIQPTLITGNECEEGAHPFTVTTLLDSQDPKKVFTEKGIPDWSSDFFGKRACLTVSSQLHLEATVLGTKRDAYCMTTAFRAEPSKSPMHLAEFLMPEWELIGGGLQRNMAVAQFILQKMFTKVLDECMPELEWLEEYRAKDDKAWYEFELNVVKNKQKSISKQEFIALKDAVKVEYSRKKSLPSIIDRLTKYRDLPFAVTTHADCVRMMLEDVAKGKIKFDVQPDYAGDLTRQHEYYITEVLFGGRPTFVRFFPKKIKAFYMPVIKEDIPIDGVEHVEGFDLLFPFVGEVVGGSQRIDSEDELIKRMTELGMKLDELQWYIDLRRRGSFPHGGAGLGFGRAMIVITGIHNIKDMQEFPRACGLACFA